MTTGQKIYELRKNARITQEQFADKLEVSRQAVSKWESDAAYPETDKLIKIAELFGVSCDYLLKEGAEVEDGVLSKRRRSFLTMLVSSAAACIAVGYIVAIICYYCIDMRESSLIGLGVFAAFLLAAFILWQVGRYRFLNECDYSDADKTHLAKMTKIWYYSSIIALFCYLPTVSMYDLLGVYYFGAGQSVIVSLNMNWYQFLLTLIAFGAAGLACARACELIHMYSLGNLPGKTEIADRVILFIVLAATAGCTAASLIFYNTEIFYRAYGYVGGLVEAPDYLYFTGSVLVGIYPAAILARVIVHKVYNKTPNSIFILHIVCCILFAITAGFGNSDMYRLAYFTGAAFTVAAITLVVVTAMFAKLKAPAPLALLGTTLPVYVFAGILLVLQAVAGIIGRFEFLWLAVFLALIALTLAIPAIIPAKSKTK